MRTNRIVSTVADKAGVLARSLVQATRGFLANQLDARQLVHRCWGWTLRPTPDEHAELRAALEAFVERRPDEAALWAELAHLYTAEHSLVFNPLPDSIRRSARAARRAIELDPSNQQGWVELAIACFHHHDEPGLSEAADRALKLNPRNSNAVAWIGAIVGHKGDYDRGCALVERAMALNSAHPGWYHFTLFNRHFARGEFNEALRAAHRVNIPDFMWMHFAIASAAGHLGLAVEGRAAVDAMEGLAPPLSDDTNLREFVTRWYWEEEMIERLLEGVRPLERHGDGPSTRASLISGARRATVKRCLGGVADARSIGGGAPSVVAAGRIWTQRRNVCGGAAVHHAWR